MGILDEAIRQHLDLKRRHGADDSEVKQLEDEAFGLPTRPGEPDFPESHEHSVVPAEGETEVAKPDATPEAAATATEAPPAPEAPKEPPVAVEPPSEEAPAVSEEPPADLASEEPTAFFDQELTAIPDAEPTPEPASEEPPSEEVPVAEAPVEPPPSEEHPIAALETVEHPMDELLADEADAEEDEEELPPATDEASLPPGPITDEQEVAEPYTGEEEILKEGAPEPEPAEGEGDVLEETPEFLRDQPEDDELWFEQGEPKDFDFD